MHDSVDELLEERRSRRPFARAGSFFAAGGLHLALLLTALLAPRLAAQHEAPPEYVAVQIVPLQALGVERPAPPRPQPTPPAPKPEPEVEEPKPVAAPVMPEPTKKPAPEKPTKKPEPAPPAPAAEATPPSKEPPGDTPEKLGSESGMASGTAAFGAQVATLDNPDFTYGYYIEQMLALIRAQWTRPPLGGGIEATVHFEVGRSGEIREVRIVQSSGYSSFDLAGLRAVQTASPLPPLPNGYKQGSLGVTLIIR
jgi:TonB family protein